MLVNRITLIGAMLGASFALSGCGSVMDKLDNAVPYVIKPYRADVHQGNLITSEMLTQLEVGMTQAQVQFLLGIPLVQDQFHPERWDYVYFLLRGNDDKQLRHLTLFWNPEGRLDRWTADEMPNEEEADQMILGKLDTFTPKAAKSDATNP